MNTFNIKVATVAVALAFSAGAMAQGITKTEYKADKDRISVEYKTAKAGCASFSDNAYDICEAKAKGNEQVAVAELEASYKPTTKNHYNVAVARAEADYGVANQLCDDRSGNAKDVCVKEAKAAAVAAKADAKAQMKSANANATAAETSGKANSKAREQSADARKDAASDKRDADYAVAKEKCDAFAGDAKSNCLNEAKARFGK